MVRTWTLMIGLVVLMGSVCTGQVGDTGTTLPGIEVAGLGSLGGLAGFGMAPGSVDSSSMLGTLEGVEATLTVFEQTDVSAGLPLNICPFWINLPDVSQMQLGMGLQLQPQTIGTLNTTQGTTGQIGGITLPTSGISGISLGGIETLNLTGLTIGNW